MNDTRGRLARFFWPTQRLDKAGLVEAIHLSADGCERRIYETAETAFTTRRKFGEKVTRLRELAHQTKRNEIGLAEAAAAWRQIVPSKRPIELVNDKTKNNKSSNQGEQRNVDI